MGTPGAWEIERFEAPCGGLPAIHSFVVAQQRIAEIDPALAESDLPDLEDYLARSADPPTGASKRRRRRRGGPIHVGHAAIVEGALRELLTEASPRTTARLYAAVDDAPWDDLLGDYPTRPWLRRVMERLRTDRRLSRGRLRRVGRWLMLHAAHRLPVAFGIELLSSFGRREDLELLATVGAEDPFTEACCRAIRRTRPEKERERALWEVWRRARSEMRAEVLDMLGRIAHPEIRASVVRAAQPQEAFYDICALEYAEAAQLDRVLSRRTVDPDLLLGAAAIIAEGLRGTRCLAGYEHLPQAALAFLRHARRAPPHLRHAVAVCALWAFLRDPDAEHRDDPNWAPGQCERVRESCRRYVTRAETFEVLRRGFAGAGRTFDDAEYVLATLGADTWPHVFERLDQGLRYWARAMATLTPSRANRMVAHAEATLPLPLLATGPAEMHAGDDGVLVDHERLAAVVRGLYRFPGHGWTLVACALRCPLIDARATAVTTLLAWTRANWPEEAEALLRGALAEEPCAHLRATMRRLLAGGGGPSRRARRR